MESFMYLKKYHSYFQGEEDKQVLSAPEVQKLTVMVLTDAIMLPSIIQFDDLLKFKTVKALEKTKHGDLVKLCTIFLTGTVSDLTEFHGKHKQLFDEHGLNFEDALSKIRLLSLATLTHGKYEMTLEEICKELGESQDNVERVVVRAISEGVIDGRIDQLNSKVLVKSSFQRTFENKEWAFLDTKLNQWIDNLESVIKFIGEQKAIKTEALGQS